MMFFRFILSNRQIKHILEPKDVIDCYDFFDDSQIPVLIIVYWVNINHISQLTFFICIHFVVFFLMFQLGFGKSMPTNCVWVDNIAESLNEKFLSRVFKRYGEITYLFLDRNKYRALIFYTNLDDSQYAVVHMRNRTLGKKKIMVREHLKKYYWIHNQHEIMSVILILSPWKMRTVLKSTCIYCLWKALKFAYKPLN